jgi:hypothetical protein
MEMAELPKIEPVSPLTSRLRTIYETPDPVEAVFLFCAEEKALAHVREDENGIVIGWDFEASPAVQEAVKTLAGNPDAPVPVSRLVDAIRALRLASVIGGETGGLPARVRVGDKHLTFVRRYIKMVGGRYLRGDLATAIEKEFGIPLDNKKLSRWIALAERQEAEEQGKR